MEREQGSALDWRDRLYAMCEPTEEWADEVDLMMTSPSAEREIERYRSQIGELLIGLGTIMGPFESLIPNGDMYDDFLLNRKTDAERKQRRIELEHEYLTLLLPIKTDALDRLLEERIDFWKEVFDSPDWNNSQRMRDMIEIDQESLNDVAEIKQGNIDRWEVVTVSIDGRTTVDDFDGYREFIPQAELQKIHYLRTGVVEEQPMRRRAS